MVNTGVLMFGSYASRRKAALSGKVNLVPLQGILAMTFFLSYVTAASFDHLSGLEIVRAIGNFGWNHLPAVMKSVEVSPTPEECAFVMTVQWCLLPLYAAVLFIGYFPFSRTIKVAFDRSSRKRPDDQWALLKLVGAMAFIVACILGDLSVISFPTLYNGGLIVKGSDHISMAALISNELTMPFISWFSVVATALIYWLPFVVVANYKSYKRAVAGEA